MYVAVLVWFTTVALTRDVVWCSRSLPGARGPLASLQHTGVSADVPQLDPTDRSRWSDYIRPACKCVCACVCVCKCVRAYVCACVCMCVHVQVCVASVKVSV